MSGPILALVLCVACALELPWKELRADEIASGEKIERSQQLLDDIFLNKASGTISNIDLTRNTFQLEGKTFEASPTNTVGPKLSDLTEGDKVTVEATDIETSKQPINVMIIKKAE